MEENKKRYKVSIEVSYHDTVEVWADNEEEARELAEEKARDDVEIYAEDIEEAELTDYRIEFVRENGVPGVFTAKLYFRPEIDEVMRLAQRFAFGDAIKGAQLVE